MANDTPPKDTDLLAANPEQTVISQKEWKGLEEEVQTFSERVSRPFAAIVLNDLIKALEQNPTDSTLIQICKTALSVCETYNYQRALEPHEQDPKDPRDKKVPLRELYLRLRELTSAVTNQADATHEAVSEVTGN